MPRKGLFDIHCHIVPSVDDGSDSREETIKMLRMEYGQGVRRIIATPHFRRRMFETPYETVKEQFQILKEAALEVSDDFEIYLGCEFHANMEMVEMLDTDQAATMAGSRYVLTEFSGSTPSSYIKERLYSLLSHGYRPIVAHIERYESMRKDVSLVEEIADMGAFIQINADSILGKEGFGCKRYCKKLLKSELVHYVGSDCHGSTRRISRIGEAYDYIEKKWGTIYADQIFIKNPQKILENAKNRKGR
ncbi:MAG TPA: capsular biosynthesis protein [Candidatus Blautia faecipullorum]|nr:capsular biosynthesis protein [Candidatus Blautia faecipullorum]